MAKQAGDIKIVGTVRNICFYKLRGQYYARSVSSLTSKRVKRDPRFRLTMVYAGLLGKASKIASKIYRQLDRSQRNRSLYQQLTGNAMQLLKQGMNEQDITPAILAMYKNDPRFMSSSEPKSGSESRVLRAEPVVAVRAVPFTAKRRPSMPDKNILVKPVFLYGKKMYLHIRAPEPGAPVRRLSFFGKTILATSA